MGDREASDHVVGRSSGAVHPLLPGRRRLNVEQLSAGIYGVIVLSATLASAARLHLVGVVVTGFTTVLVYWVAEEFAHGLAHRTVAGRLTAADVGHSLRDRFTMVETSVLPLLVVLVVGVLGASVSTAVIAGLVVAALSLAVLGAIAARRSGLSVVGTLMAAMIATALGGAAVLLKIAYH
jgi:hypothetical protein